MTLPNKYFKAAEFACKCTQCDGGTMDGTFIDNLTRARKLAKVAFAITSGYRCATHNVRVGGTPDSSHLRGLAADVKVTSSHHRFVIIESLLQSGFNRIGVADKFIHVDLDPDKVPMVLWTYQGDKV